MNNNIKTDCLHFPLDRPCIFHKEKAIKCFNCKNYSPFLKKEKFKSILIIKLDAMGDVLRTTFLLPGLKEKYGKNCKITWLVSKNSAQVLYSNPLINKIIVSELAVIGNLCLERYDVVINLDLSPLSLMLATAVCSAKNIGYWLKKDRQIACSNIYAKKWLSMSAFDDLKKANTKTYQYWMAKITEIKKTNYPIYVPLNKESLDKAENFAKKNNLVGKKIIGINPGAGGRWELKRWTKDGYKYLIEQLSLKGFKVILLGGPQEAELVSELVKSSNAKAISIGTNNSIPDFFAYLNLCNVVLTGDTMAMHAALGLKKKVVVLFGPTSSAEIEIYSLGVKIIPQLNCLCCYKTSCDIKPNCMQSINKDTVLNSVLKLAKGIK